MKNWLKKSEKMRRYRSNVRSDAARLEKMGKKNREYKKAKRDLQRQAIQNGNTKLEKRSKCKETLRWKDTEIKRKQRTEKLRLKWRKLPTHFFYKNLNEAELKKNIYIYKAKSCFDCADDLLGSVKGSTRNLNPWNVYNIFTM